jgi:hypothetical protein
MASAELFPITNRVKKNNTVKEMYVTLTSIKLFGTFESA